MVADDEVSEAIAHANLSDTPPLGNAPEHRVQSSDDARVVFDATGVDQAQGTNLTAYPPPSASHAQEGSSSSSMHPPQLDDPTLHAATALGRASVDALSFNFRDHILPLSLSAADESTEDVEAAYAPDRLDASAESREISSHRAPARRTRRVRFAPTDLTPPTTTVKRVKLLDGIALTVGMQVGSGIFSSPGVLTLRAGSVGASLCVWIVSGFLAWTGAASFAELGAMIPLNGGAQSYLYFSLGALPSYLFSWTAITALKPGGGAIIAIIFGEYVARIILHFRRHEPEPAPVTSASGIHAQALAVEELPVWLSKIIAVSLIVVLSIVHCLSARLGTRLQNLTTALKVMALVATPIFSAIQLARGHMPEESRVAFSSVRNLFAGSSTSWGSYALALYSGLWAFDGWDQVCYIAGEMKNVKRDLPRVIHISLSSVLLLFLLTVISYFLILPPKEVAKSNTVALDFGRTVLGATGGVVFASIVAFSCLGALNAGFITTARLITTAASEGYLPGGPFFAAIHLRRKTPIRAIVLESVLMCIFVLAGDGFSSMVNFYGVCSWGGYFATVMGLLVLRVRESAWERPYKVCAVVTSACICLILTELLHQTWLSTPILFSSVALFLLMMPIFAAPLEALAALAFVLAGVPMFYLTQRQNGTGNQAGCWPFCSRSSTSGYAGVATEVELDDSLPPQEQVSGRNFEGHAAYSEGGQYDQPSSSSNLEGTYALGDSADDESDEEKTK